MVIPTLMWFDDPRTFLSINWKEISRMISFQCRKCLKYPAGKYEEEIRFHFIMKFMRGRYKYEPGRSLLTNFINKVVFWSIRSFFYDWAVRLSRGPELVPLDENLVGDSLEGVETAIDVSSFMKNFNTKFYKGRKIDRREILVLSYQGYSQREIAKKLKISTVHVSMTMTKVRQVFASMNLIGGLV
jgi:hypothetical protein